MRITSNNAIARAIYLALKDKTSAELYKILPQVVQFLARRRLLSKASAILSELEKIINADMGVVAAKVWSAHKLDSEVKKDLVHFLKKRYSGKEVNLLENLDENLLGGFKVETNDEVIDVTLRSKINQLTEHLMSKAAFDIPYVA